MRASCGACQDGLHAACGGYRGPLETYLCGCYERNAGTDPGMHPNTYQGRQWGQQEDDMTDASAIVSEFIQMALDDDPVSRETNMTAAASLMSEDERSRARQAAHSMLAYLTRAEARSK